MIEPIAAIPPIVVPIIRAMVDESELDLAIRNYNNEKLVKLSNYKLQIPKIMY